MQEDEHQEAKRSETKTRHFGRAPFLFVVNRKREKRNEKDSRQERGKGSEEREEHLPGLVAVVCELSCAVQ